MDAAIFGSCNRAFMPWRLVRTSLPPERHQQLAPLDTHCSGMVSVNG